jgi:hypothetical protein
LKKTQILAVVSLAALSSGCSMLPSFDFNEGVEVKPVEVQVKTVEVKTPIVHPVLPRKLQLKEPKWFVVSEKNFEQFQKEVSKRAGSLVFIAMTVDDYELMAYNMQEIKRYVNEMKEVIIYYRTINDEPKQDEVKSNTDTQ